MATEGIDTGGAELVPLDFLEADRMSKAELKSSIMVGE